MEWWGVKYMKFKRVVALMCCLCDTDGVYHLHLERIYDGMEWYGAENGLVLL